MGFIANITTEIWVYMKCHYKGRGFTSIGSAGVWVIDSPRGASATSLREISDSHGV